MYFVNDKNDNVVDYYQVKFDGDFNMEKLKYLLTETDINLKKNFIFQNKYNTYTTSSEGPLYYPISTLYASFLCGRDIFSLVEPRIAYYITHILNLYDPEVLYPVYDVIKDDDTLEKIKDKDIDAYLMENYKDIAILRELINHSKFEYAISADFSGMRDYMRKHILPGLMPAAVYNDYVTYEKAKCNSKVKKMLRLEPIIK